MHITLHGLPLDYKNETFAPPKQIWLKDYPVCLSENLILLDLSRFHINGTFTLTKRSAEARGLLRLFKDSSSSFEEIDALFLDLISKSVGRKEFSRFLQLILTSTFSAGYSNGIEDKMDEIQKLLGFKQEKEEIQKPW